MKFVGTTEYTETPVIDEKSYQHLVDAFRKHLFGTEFYFPIAQRFSSKVGGTDSDGIAIWPAKQSWAIVEVERAEHSLDHHVMPQLQRQHEAILDGKTVTNLAGKIQKQKAWPRLARALKETTLTAVLATRPNVVLVIDFVTQALEHQLRLMTIPIVVVKATPFKGKNAKPGLLIDSPYTDGHVEAVVPITKGTFMGKAAILQIPKAEEEKFPEIGRRVTLFGPEGILVAEIIRTPLGEGLRFEADALNIAIPSLRAHSQLRFQPIQPFQAYRIIQA